MGSGPRLVGFAASVTRKRQLFRSASLRAILFAMLNDERDAKATA